MMDWLKGVYHRNYPARVAVGLGLALGLVLLFCQCMAVTVMASGNGTLVFDGGSVPGSFTDLDVSGEVEDGWVLLEVSIVESSYNQPHKVTFRPDGVAVSGPGGVGCQDIMVIRYTMGVAVVRAVGGVVEWMVDNYETQISDCEVMAYAVETPVEPMEGPMEISMDAGLLNVFLAYGAMGLMLLLSVVRKGILFSVAGAVSCLAAVFVTPSDLHLLVFVPVMLGVWFVIRTLSVWRHGE